MGGGRGSALQNLMGGVWRGLKTLTNNTCEGVHLIVKLSTISLQAYKFTKYELLHTYFSSILATLLFIALFLGIISCKGVSCFNRKGAVFQMGGVFIFKRGGMPHGGHRFWWGFEKNRRMEGERFSMPTPLWETEIKMINSLNFNLLGWCPAVPVLPHGERVPL